MSALKPTRDALTPQQQKFAAFLVEGFKPVDAARAAGYKAPEMAGWQLQKSAHVMRYVGELLKDTARRLDCLSLSALARSMAPDKPAAEQLKAVDIWMKHRPQDLLGGEDRSVTVEELERIEARLKAMVDAMPPEPGSAPMIDITPVAGPSVFD